MTHKNTDIPTAVFIDGDWLYAASRRISKRIDYAKFYNILINNFGRKTRIYFYGAINPVDKKQTRFSLSLKRIGYKVHCTKLIKRGAVFISKGMEMELAMDAVRILPTLKKLVLVSGDSDFVPLLKHAVKNKVSVFVIALPFTVGYSLKKIAGGAFVNFEILIKVQKDNKKLPISKKGEKKEILVPDSLYIEKGDCFESYIRIRNLMKSAKNNINIIDQYIDDQILTVIQLLETDISITIFTNKISPEDFSLQVKKLRNEGRIITVYKTNIFHDRFLGIDNIWWHSGYSFKDLGQRDSLITKVTKKSTVDKLIERVTKASQNSIKICQ
ncbi:NYN domain-containing protein [Patescibacteria group bacterium]|nr:NYN domain-containing protein [Candidatus Falkowbacteria bacterium]MBU3905947.1 NYN domain-containing protein [Patescibacteria group bacterium]MCG2698352.1 NYN domain-containing protein [Candidatus Parcubacteria bacterium]MBU4027040.1 NYN domain-containing protein [Patescibacteria group bacterium]MBU4073249.1 NYN domain-containing protein [Patescibacteria group bacterium]